MSVDPQRAGLRADAVEQGLETDIACQSILSALACALFFPDDFGIRYFVSVDPQRAGLRAGELLA